MKYTKENIGEKERGRKNEYWKSSKERQAVTSIC